MIIDFHTHVFPKEVRENRDLFIKTDPYFKMLYGAKNTGKLPKIAGISDLIAAMDKSGIEKSVVCGFCWSNHELCQKNNDYILEGMERFPDRIIGLAAIYTKEPENSVLEIERTCKCGMKGVGELIPEPQGVLLSDHKLIKPIMKTIKELKIPLLLHVNETIGHDYPGKGKTELKQYYNFILDYPDINIVLAHWGGGLFFYEMMPEVKKIMKNVFYDISASPFIYSSKIFSIALQIVGSDKVLFATDYPLINQKRYIDDIENMGFSETDKKNLYGKNAQKLLNL